MIRILALFVVFDLILAAPALSQAASDDAASQQHGSGGNGWSGDLGGARNASKNDRGDVERYYTAPVATGLDLKGPTKTEGPFAE